jgi:hypothetical protein
MRAVCPVAWRVFVGLLLFGTFSAQAAPVLYATGVGRQVPVSVRSIPLT